MTAWTPILALTRRMAFALPLAAAIRPARAAEAERVRIGLLHTLSPAPLYIAMQRGYFGDQGIDAQFRFFDAAQPIAAAAVSGDIDLGITALTGGFFSLAGRGLLKVIAGGLHEQKGWPGIGLLASKGAFDAGLTSPAKLAGHSLGITQYGSSFHYMAGRIAQVEGFDLKTVTLRPLQTIQNMLAAVRTGQVDATMAIASQARPADASGEARLIAWVGDLVPYQLTAMFARSGLLAGDADAVHRTVRAYQRGVADYRTAFLRRDAAGQPMQDESTDTAVADITHYVFEGDAGAKAKILADVGWYDADAALDADDVARQVRWFGEQGLIREAADPASLIDLRFVPALGA